MGDFGDKYVFPEIIGCGSYGLVLKVAERRIQSSFCVVKLLPTVLPKVIESVKNNVERLADTQNHPNLVTIYDAGEIKKELLGEVWKDTLTNHFTCDSKLTWVVMDLCLCTTLQEVYDNKDKQVHHCSSVEYSSIDDAIRDATKGLLFLHSHGIIHRDVKPTNVLLSGDGKTWKLGDTGLADVANSSRSPNPLSCFYEAPNRFVDKPLPSCDVYSLGMVLFFGLFRFNDTYSREEAFKDLFDSPAKLNMANFSVYFSKNYLPVVTSMIHRDVGKRCSLQKAAETILCPPNYDKWYKLLSQLQKKGKFPVSYTDICKQPTFKSFAVSDLQLFLNLIDTLSDDSLPCFYANFNTLLCVCLTNNVSVADALQLCTYHPLHYGLSEDSLGLCLNKIKGLMTKGDLSELFDGVKL